MEERVEVIRRVSDQGLTYEQEEERK